MKNWKLELCVKTEEISSHVRLAASVAMILLLSLSASFAQTKVEPKIYTPAPTAQPNPVPTATPSQRTPRPPRIWTTRSPRRVDNEGDAPAEKSISAAQNVNVLIPCIAEGNVKINGWDRDEIRAYVDGGSAVGFKVLQLKNQNPVWVKVLGYDPQKNKEPGLDECISGNEIELDVPQGATVGISGREMAIRIRSVNKVKVENVAGSILLNNIAQGVSAKTQEGDVIIENSGGTMTLFTSNGNIVAFGTEANDIGDTFTAKTSSGAITLQNVEQRQIQASSISGSIRYNGEIASGGQYSFGTTNGSINLLLPANTSCKIKAFYGGSFQSEIPLEDIVKTPSPVQSLTARIGSGDASVLLNTFGGTIRIRKQ